MAWKSNGQRLGAYFCETNVRDGKTAKPIVSSPKYAIFSHVTGDTFFNLEVSQVYTRRFTWTIRPWDLGP